MKRSVSWVLSALVAVALAACAVPGESSEVAPTEVKPVPTVRRVMTATDPSTFVRAAGYPQFVEFFAFW